MRAKITNDSFCCKQISGHEEMHFFMPTDLFTVYDHKLPNLKQVCIRLNHHINSDETPIELNLLNGRA